LAVEKAKAHKPKKNGTSWGSYVTNAATPVKAITKKVTLKTAAQAKKTAVKKAVTPVKKVAEKKVTAKKNVAKPAAVKKTVSKPKTTVKKAPAKATAKKSK
jgi:hypothetical protein